MKKVAILSEKVVIWWICSALLKEQSLISQFEINYVIQQTIARANVDHSNATFMHHGKCLMPYKIQKLAKKQTFILVKNETFCDHNEVILNCSEKNNLSCKYICICSTNSVFMLLEKLLDTDKPFYNSITDMGNYRSYT